jgi:Na+-translocating ferredoxin:NAD+ oxidoreductase subunit C
VPLLNRYPQADPTVLIWTLLAQRLSVGALPTSIGVLLVDPVTCWALGRFLRDGTTYQYRPVQVFVEDRAPQLVLAPLGMAIDALLTHVGVPFGNQQCIRNGMLTGRQIDSAHNVVEEDTEMIAVRRFPAVENPTPCIECGWCVDHSPTALNPAKLYHQNFAGGPGGDGREARHCIDCGLCSYVCPTRLPLTQRIVDLRATLNALKSANVTG